MTLLQDAAIAAALIATHGVAYRLGAIENAVVVEVHDEDCLV